MLFERTYEEILSEALTDLSNNTRITNVSPGSTARALLEAYSRHTNEAYQIFDLNLARAFLSGANGRFLDFIGELVGLERLNPEAAVASSESKSVRFYVDTGTFGDINGGASIVLPAGTVVSSEEGDSGITYRTTLTITLSSALSEAFVPVEAIQPGAQSNVGSNTLSFHNFTNYSDFLNDTLNVDNPNGIFTGRDLESDTNYRFRISQQVVAAEAGNLTAIRLAALSVPGVADIELSTFARGIGTYDVLIKSITPSVSDTLREAVQAAISEVTSQGIIGLARRPKETGMAFEITIYYRTTPGESLTNSVKETIENNVIENLTNYVNSLDIGEEFIINEAVQRVLETDDRIKDIGVPSKPFDEISLWFETKLQDNKIRQTLLKNYDPDDDERLIIEPSLATPIVINRGN